MRAMNAAAVAVVCVLAVGHAAGQTAGEGRMARVAREQAAMTEELTIRMVDELDHEVRVDQRERMIESVTCSALRTIRDLATPPLPLPEKVWSAVNIAPPAPVIGIR